MRRMIISLAAAMLAFSAGGGCQQWNNMWHKDAAKEERISMTALPEPVRAAFKRDFPNANVTYVARETEKDGAVHFPIKFTDQSGRAQEVEYDGNGNRAHEEK